MMKINRINILKIAVAALFCASCNDDDTGVVTTDPDPVIEDTTDPAEPTEPIEPVIVCGDILEDAFVMSLKTTGGNETEFIVSSDDIMSGEITAEGNGIEQTGWRFYYPVNKTLFATGYTDDNLGQAYISNSAGQIAQIGEFTFDNSLEMFGTDDASTLLAMEISRTDYLRVLRLINGNTGTVEQILDIEIFQELNFEDPTQSIVAWPTAIEVRGDKLFIPFQKMKPDFTTTEPNTAYVAVYSYPVVEGETPTIISDDRTGNLGVNGFTTGLIEADNGNLYGYSSGSVMAGFTEQSTKPSGILKINSGEDDFDEDYFFDVEAVAGGRIFSWDYAGNNKALARILTTETGVAWDAYGRYSGAAAFNQKLVVIDLEAQTVTDVANVPLHALRYSSPLLVEGCFAYVSVETETEAYVYRVNIEDAEGTQGAKIIGKTIKGFYRLQ